jgi:hypothetical protein
MLSAMPALAVGAQKAPVALDLKFRLMARGVSGFTVSGRYVGFTQTTSTRKRTTERFVLLDDYTGKRLAAPSPASCNAGVVGVPWVALYCANPSPASQPFELYNIRTHKVRRLPCDAVCRRTYYLSDVRAVGSRWVAIEVEPHEPCGDGIHRTCGPTTYMFYNIATGKRRAAPMSSRTIIDLDSPTLTRQICPPLQDPAGSDSTAFPPPLMFYGSLAVVQEQNGIYVERCGSRLHIPLVGGNYAGSMPANTQAVAFCADAQQQWSGIFLPGLRRFTFRVPVGPSCGVTVLAARHVYTVSADPQWRLWYAAFPSKPPGLQSTLGGTPAPDRRSHRISAR